MQRERERDRETETETDRQRQRQTDRQTDRELYASTRCKYQQLYANSWCQGNISFTYCLTYLRVYVEAAIKACMCVQGVPIPSGTSAVSVLPPVSQLLRVHVLHYQGLGYNVISRPVSSAGHATRVRFHFFFVFVFFFFFCVVLRLQRQYGLLGTGAQDVHLDFPTAPELCS